MAWDLALSRENWDLTGGEISGQDEILQRVEVRLRRNLSEWFLNTSAGLPWYDGASELEQGVLTRENGMLGSRNFARVALLIRNEIMNTEGVLRIVEFKHTFDSATREFRIQTIIATQYGISGVLSLVQRVS